MLDEMNITPLFSHEKMKTCRILPAAITGGHSETAATRVDKHVGWQLRFQRQKLGLSVTSVARACNIPSTDWAAYENGDCRPSAGLLMTMARALEVPLSYFFEGL